MSATPSVAIPNAQGRFGQPKAEKWDGLRKTMINAPSRGSSFPTCGSVGAQAASSLSLGDPYTRMGVADVRHPPCVYWDFQLSYV